MIRNRCPKRPNFSKKLISSGYGYHEDSLLKSWHEGAFYAFTKAQLNEHILPAITSIERMCLEIIPSILSQDSLLDDLWIPEKVRPYLRESWQSADVSLLGRMDFAYDGISYPKLLEYNADTPAVLYESAFLQTDWLNEMQNIGFISHELEQFNKIPELLVAAIKKLALVGDTIDLICYDAGEHDRTTTRYVENCASYAGFKTRYHSAEKVELSNVLLSATHIFKHIPWEWIFEDDDAINILTTARKKAIYEPLWRYLLSNKLLLVWLWEAYPNSPFLLPAFPEFFEHGLASFVRKPLLSREGKNIKIVVQNEVVETTEGPYGTECGYIVQQYQPLPRFGAASASLCGWVVNGQPAAICVREQPEGFIHQEKDYVVPHIIA